MLIMFETKEMMFNSARITDDNTCIQYFNISIWKIFKARRIYKPIHWHICIAPFWTMFFKFAGRQNDYLYPSLGQNPEHYPFSKPHLWKTRIGIKTAWELAKIINNK